MAENDKTRNANAAQDTSKAPGEPQTTKEEQEHKDAVPATPEKQDNGSVAERVAGNDKDAQKEVKDFEKGKVDAPVGTTVEADRDGQKYDAPYTLLTPQNAVARTSDSDDPAKDWTAQHASGERKDEEGKTLDAVALTPVAGTPGQTFTVGELPEREVAEKAGVNYDQFVAGLPVRGTVKDEAPRRGTPA